MTPEIRRAALRAAAKAALVVSLGCSSSPKPPQPSNTGDPVAPAAMVPCAQHLGALATAKPDELADGDPLKTKPGVYGAFADVAARTSARTVECCTEDIKTHGSSSKLRWECCSALPDVPEGGDQTACTPWGPPCPPAMA